jgi:triosephosphate isomerase
MARTPLIAGNWKMNLSVAEGRALVAALKARLGANVPCEVLVCPVFVGIHPVAAEAAGSPVQVGGQNCYWETSGAFTAEVSAPLLKEAGASHVLLGHSERRQLFGETDESINRRLVAALDAGLVPVLCIGETLAEREAGQLEAVLARQVGGALDGIPVERLGSLVVAYEPVWAIGTGVVATTEQAQEAHALVRGLLVKQHGAAWAGGVRILYGGSVKPDNAAGLLSQADIDGALVGGASLKADSFAAIIDAVAAAR